MYPQQPPYPQGNPPRQGQPYPQQPGGWNNQVNQPAGAPPFYDQPPAGNSGGNQAPPPPKQVKRKKQKPAKKPQNRQTRPTPPKKKRGLGGIFFVILVVGISAYYIFSTLIPLGGRQGSALVASGSLGDTYRGQALIVRNEQVFKDTGVYSVEYIAQEGSLVYRKDPICKVYTSSHNQRDIVNLNTVRSDIKSRLEELINQEARYDQELETLDGNVLNKVKEVRKIAQGAKGNLLNIELDLASEMTSRKGYLKTAFSDDQRLTRLYSDENNYVSRVNSYTSSKTAGKQGIVSFYTDGYEGLSTTSMEEYTPKQVADMIAGGKPSLTPSQKGETPIYRLVDENLWGVFLLIDNTQWNPTAGNTYKLKLEQFENTLVDVKIISTTKAGDKLLLRMEVDGPVTPVLDMRTCSAELGVDVGSLVVPKKSIRTRDDMTGVVVLVDGVRKTFVPVQVIRETKDDAYVVPVTQGMLYEGLTVLVY